MGIGSRLRRVEIAVRRRTERTAETISDETRAEVARLVAEATAEDCPPLTDEEADSFIAEIEQAIYERRRAGANTGV